MVYHRRLVQTNAELASGKKNTFIQLFLSVFYNKIKGGFYIIIN